MRLKSIYETFSEALKGQLEDGSDPDKLFFYAGAVLTYETWGAQADRMRKQGINKNEIIETIQAYQEQMVTDGYRYLSDYLKGFDPVRLKNH